MPVNHRDKRFFMHTVFEVRKSALWKKYKMLIKSCFNLKRVFAKAPAVGVVVKDIAIGAGGLGFDFQTGQIV